MARQHQDMAEALCERVRQADHDKTPLKIVGGDTKAFYGRRVEGDILSTRDHHGISHYDPVELIISVRAGTLISELEAALDAEGQRLPFEPPHFGESATVGGMIATGLSGPRRPWAGSVRDFVLGSRIITHEGKHLRFGGEVMKNVAGYDLSRLMAGAQGTLGLLTEVSLKVLPKPTATHSLRLAMPLASALESLAEWGRQPLPITAAAYHDGALHLRLEGGPSSVAATRERLGGDVLDDEFWTQLREHQLPFFADTDERPLWRLSLPNNTPALELETRSDTDVLYDWGGAQRWVRTSIDGRSLRDAVATAGGHATCYTPGASDPFMPLAPSVAKYHRRLKATLDPNGIFNPGRLYAEV
ncbi:glycolate oxidase subunit GlcE [Aidingimonas halophila]|uniref:Glycolate oxidase FAD binding subunit n=1 Tax=Aidingimonas halophila TaxID=574349 RepID=A0A1H2SNP1_9GAMM|nr:glycolate oxidase subunit GlcE [Aidingimonas halophila]GHC17430.1 glycolate oxidase subunit GlcE [Aidingimonas halophila]SDW32704.1 glycolate oxidase FAD binding subunit [Aidingimonas halophila]